MNNNDIRELLNLPLSDNVIDIHQVDTLGNNTNTLMFINKRNLNLSNYDSCVNNVFLVDITYPEYKSEYNDFIRVANPKYKFCKIVEKFKLKSKFQLESEEKIIGKRCQIDPGVILGGTDFSPVLTDKGSLVQFPQMGGVSIGNDVVIKYNTMIGKGTFGYTEIGNNTMIDFGCQVGHNCSIGERCIIAAGTIIGGSTTIGDDTVIGIGARIRNGLKIGKNVSIGMGAVVIHDVPDNTVVVGNPAHPINHNKIFNEGGLK